MQTIYGAGLASNIQITAQKRLIRPAYAQTQGYPYAAYLDPFLRTAVAGTSAPAGTFLAPLSSDSPAGSTTNNRAAANPVAYTANTFTYMGSVVPGTVMIKTSGENVAPHPGGGTWTASGAAGTFAPFGLLGQWLGGTFDNVGLNNQVGVWLGPDSVYELLAPGFNAGGMSAALNAAGTPVPLYAGTNGLLSVAGQNGAANTNPVVAYLLDMPSASRILIKMAI